MIKVIGVLVLLVGLGLGAWLLLGSSAPTPVDVEQGVVLEAAEAAALPTVAALRERMDREGLERLDEHLRGLLAAGEAGGEELIQLSTSARWLGRAQEAVQHGAAAVAALPGSSAAHLAYSKALGASMQTGGMFVAMRLMGDYKRAAAAARAADPDDIDARLDEIGFLIVVPGLVGGDRAAARELAAALVADDPVQGHVMQALADLMDEDYEVAEDRCRRALDEFPDAGSLHLMLANVLVKQERWEAARASYDRVLETDAGEAHYRALYGRARMGIENAFDQEQAIADMTAYAQARPYGDMLPTAADAWWRMGQAHSQLGRPDEARAAYQQAVALSPDHEGAKDALEALP